MLATLVLALFSSPAEIRIYRDLYGVPSIVASSYIDACYGLGYATVEDHGERMALNFKQARGRMGEVQGKSQLLTDGFIRSLGIEDLARARARGRDLTTPSSRLSSRVRTRHSRIARQVFPHGSSLSISSTFSH